MRTIKSEKIKGRFQGLPSPYLKTELFENNGTYIVSVREEEFFGSSNRYYEGIDEYEAIQKYKELREIIEFRA